jgi:hypothetical protein
MPTLGTRHYSQRSALRGARGVIHVRNRVAHQLANVVILDSVIDPCPLASRTHQVSHPQLCEVLRHRIRRLPESLGEVIDRLLGFKERPENTNPGRIGEHAKHFNGQIDLIVGKRSGREMCIC